MRPKGSKNKNGVRRIINCFGYAEIFKPDHPMSKRNGYVLEHRMIAFDNGILTNTINEVHHLNGEKSDNRLKNLKVLSRGEHTSLTWKGRSRTLNAPKCKFCDTRTRSKYNLCRKHYKLEWQRGNINIHENPELL